MRATAHRWLVLMAPSMPDGYSPRNEPLHPASRAASILFYKRKGPERQIINESTMDDTTRRLNKNNGKPNTNPNTQHFIEYSPQIRNAHANTKTFDNPHNWL